MFQVWRNWNGEMVRSGEKIKAVQLKTTIAFLSEKADYYWEIRSVNNGASGELLYSSIY